MKFPQRSPDDAILATVVDVSGSGYRRPGARLLFTRSGERFGMISGGCLERDLVKHGFQTAENGPALVVYDTRGNRLDPGGPYNTGCDGIISIFLERIEKGADLQFLTPPEPQPFALVYRSSDETLVGAHFHDPRFDSIRDIVHPAISARSKSLSIERDGVRSELFVQMLLPVPHAVLFGSGDDVIPIAEIFETLGWRHTIVSRNELTNTERRFPESERVVSRYTSAIASLDRCDAYVLATHDFDDDRIILEHLLNRAPRYIGIVGPKRRTARLAERLIDDGVSIDLQRFAKIRTPVGLDLGGDDPREVALAIVSEVVAMKNDRTGGALSDRDASIHDAHLRESL